MKNNILPEWFNAVRRIISIGQAEIFVLHGDVDGYPQEPQESVSDFLRTIVLNNARKGIEAQGLAVTASTDPTMLAESGLFTIVSPASGLDLESEPQTAVFNRYAPDPNGGDNPFAQAPSGGAVLESFERLNVYFRNGEAPPITVVIRDADLLFGADGPIVEPERTLLSFLRLWAARPLLNASGAPHMIFLLSSALNAIRPELLSGGRIEPVNIPLPSTDERTAFIGKVLALLESESGAPIDFRDFSADELARTSGALNLLQIEDILYQAEIEDGALSADIVQKRKDDLVKRQYAGIIQIEYPDFNFDQLVGYQQLKNYMLNFVAVEMRAGKEICPKGCLLTGPPGTGKTQFARALASSLRLPLVLVQMDKIKSKYVGESNKNMARLTEAIAALSPAIVLLDELDKIMPASDDSSGVSQEILGQLQTFLSDFPRGKAFFIGTTNFPKKVPPAMLRPGRLEQVIPLLPAHLDGNRAQAYPVIAARLNAPLSQSIDWDSIADKSADYTGADIELVIGESYREMVESGAQAIDQNHIELAIANIIPTVNNARAMLEQAIKSCTNGRYLPESAQAVASAPQAQPITARRARKGV